MKYIKLNILLATVVALLLSSCGGSTETGTIGGTTTGLSSAATVVLQDNGGDNLTVTGNASSGPVNFTFASQIDAGSTYDVTILTQPAGENCVVENAVGVVEPSIGNVNSVVVVCNIALSAANDLTGQVNGLALGAQLILLNNGTQNVTITGTGAASQVFAFPLPLALNATYSVVVQNNPTGQTCSAINAAGTITASGQIPTQYTDPKSGVTVLNTNNVVAGITVTCK